MSLRPTVGNIVHPALLAHTVKRAENVQNRIADRITRFAGSMAFIYISIIWFTLWIVLKVEKFPYGLLTMIVSLEAIFLSTFVMISQNRADEKRQVLADNQWKIVQAEEAQNEQLIELTEKILELTTAIHKIASAIPPAGPAVAGPGSGEQSTQAP